MSRTFIAEKPSLAAEIASALCVINGSKKSKDSDNSHWIVGQDKVTWLYGHMYQTAMPQTYDERYKKWSIEDLPIIPEKWKLIPRKDTMKQLKAVRNLIKGSKRIVNAGDAAREGQLLVDEVLLESGWNPFNDATERLWVSSVVQKDLIAAIKSMKPNATKRALYESAISRQRADWTHGINMSRLWTKVLNGPTISIGRVKTPTLRIVVERDLEIENFVPKDHFTPVIKFKKDSITFLARYISPKDAEGTDDKGRFLEKHFAEDVINRVRGKRGIVESFEAKKVSSAPPLLFSLSKLQAACSREHGLTAKQTLDVVQALYEKHKMVTYPRSDSEYLPTSMFGDITIATLHGLSSISDFEIAKDADKSIQSKVFNDSKISDHHAIIPTTECSPEKFELLSNVEKRVFSTIAKQFIAQFFPNSVKEVQTAVLIAGNDKFKASGSREIVAGFRTVLKNNSKPKKDDDDTDNQILPTMVKGDDVENINAEIKEGKTTPPAHFTDGTLITAMSKIERFLSSDEKDAKKILKSVEGLGTEATRSNILEELISSEYLSRSTTKGSKSKKIISTPIGRAIIKAIPDDISSPILTAEMEEKLTEIAKGKLSASSFMELQTDILKSRIEEAKKSTARIEHNRPQKKSVKPIEGHGEDCPKCNKGKMTTRVIGKGDNKGKSFLGCSNYPECKHAQWPTPSKAAKQKAAANKPKLKPVKSCPKCDGGQLVERSGKYGKFLSCNAYPKCNHSEKTAA